MVTPQIFFSRNIFILLCIFRIWLLWGNWELPWEFDIAPQREYQKPYSFTFSEDAGVTQRWSIYHLSYMCLRYMKVDIYIPAWHRYWAIDEVKTCLSILGGKVWSKTHCWVFLQFQSSTLKISLLANLWKGTKQICLCLERQTYQFLLDITHQSNQNLNQVQIWAEIAHLSIFSCWKCIWSAKKLEM